MAKLRIPKGDGFKVFGGQDDSEQPAAADESQENTTLADTATALLEGGGDDGGENGHVECSPEVESFYEESIRPLEGIDEPVDDLPTGHYEQPAEGEIVTEQPTDEQAATEPTAEQPATDADQPVVVPMVLGRPFRFSTNMQLQCSMIRTNDDGEHCILGSVKGADAWITAEKATDNNVLRFSDDDAAQAFIAEKYGQPVVDESVAVLEEVPASEVPAITAATDPHQIIEAMRLRLQRAQAIREWQQNCEDAKENFVAAALAHAELKAATKIAKAEEEDAMEEYAKLMRQNPDVAYAPTNAPINTRPVAEVSSEQPSSDAATLVDNGEAGASESPSGQSSPDAWRSTPISCLSSLTPKLIERLEEAGLTTMGKLEDHRAKIAIGHEKWPKGIGEVKITAIEDAIIDWLNENRDREVFADLASGRAMGELVEGQADGDDAEEADDATSEDDSQGVDNSAILARAAEIDNGESDALSEKIVDAGYWEQGWNHHQNGEPLETCDWSASAAQDDFIRGYLSAAKADGYGKGNEVVAEQPATESPANPTPTDLDIVDLDNL